MEYDIETFSLTKYFSDWWGRNKVCAVDNLNLKVRRNEVFGLLGPNGSGKTTTLKMLLGLLYPTKGKAVMLGGDSADPKISARIGFMPEESYLYKYLSARETLDFYGRLFDLPGKIRKDRIESLLDMVGLRAVAGRAIGTYSKGMARRIGLAQALINDPDLLILDEPTTGLDPIGTRQIKDLIIEMAQRGKTVLLCSHLLADVEDICDRIAILYGGKIQTEGKVKELLCHSDKKQITTGYISDSTIEKIKRIIEAENSDCVITSPMEKLETFFIQTVTDAEKTSQATSGAISSTGIGDFLKASPKEDTILDKLVTGHTYSKPTSTDTRQTQSIGSAENKEQKADRQVLEKLTEQSEQVQTKPVNRSEPIQPPVDKSQEDKNILDKLTGKPLGDTDNA